jgi:hypothetical protein
MSEAIDLERRTRESEAIGLRRQLEGFGAEGLHIEIIGVCLLLVGVELATIPSEIACGWEWIKNAIF